MREHEKTTAQRAVEQAVRLQQEYEEEQRWLRQADDDQDEFRRFMAQASQGNRGTNIVRHR